MKRQARRRRPQAAPGGGAERMAVLEQAGRIAEELAMGLTPDAAARVAPRLRDLLGVDGIALFSPTAPLAWAGVDPDEPAVAALAGKTAESGRTERRADRCAAPLVADGQ